MGIKVSDLQKDRRSITAKIRVGQDADGEDVEADLELTYRPSAYTGKTEKELNELAKGEWKSEMGLEFIRRLVIEWDLEDDNGTVPITIEALETLPATFITDVIVGIGDDMGKDRRSSKGS